MACGSCTGAVAGGASACASDATVVLATHQPGAGAIVLDADSVYWTTMANLGAQKPSDQGAVVTVPRCGGTPVTLASGQSIGRGLAVDDARVYWTTVSASGSAGTSDVLSVPKAGGAIVTLASGVGAAPFLAVDGSDVYWTSATAGTVSKVPKTGGAVTVVAAQRTNPREIAVDEGTLVWLDDALVSMALAGGAVTTLAHASAPVGLQLAGGLAYWSSQNAGGDVDILRVPLAGGTPATIATVTTGWVGALAVDGDDLVFSAFGPAPSSPGTIGHVDVEGGAVTTVASQLGYPPSGVALDGASVYWLDADGAVMKGPR